MNQKNKWHRVIADYSNTELELQKEIYRKPSMEAIVGIKQLLADLEHEGVYVQTIHNYEQSPCISDFPDSIRMFTGESTVERKSLCPEGVILVIWDFWRGHVIQHVIEPVEI